MYGNTIYDAIITSTVTVYFDATRGVLSGFVELIV